MNSSNPGSSVSPPRPRFRRLRRVVLALAIIGTLTALFYAVEDWRGRAAWEKCKSELDAKGLRMDWTSYIPMDTVPADENFFKAPKMADWFVKKDPSNYTNQIAWKVPFVGGSNPIVVAEVTVVVSEGSAGIKSDGALRLDDPEAAQKAQKAVLDAIGPHVFGAQGYTYVTRPAEKIEPVQIFLRADKMPGQEQLTALFPEDALAPHDYIRSTTTALKIQAAGSNLFRIVLDPPPQSAAAFVSATDEMKGDFDLLRDALKRPYARAEGNYASPATQPVLNFVQVRFAAQLFSERAQCHLMLGQPEEALEDLTVIQDLCRMLECRPSGPTTLVGPMINVAVRGLYSLTVAEGIRLGAWREPQLMALEQELQQVDLPAQVRAGFREAGAAFCDVLGNFSAGDFARTMQKAKGGGVPERFWDYIG